MGLLDQQVPFPGDTTPGPLALTVFELRAIADAVESLTAVRGQIPYVDVAGHRVGLERHSDQRDGDWYTVTAITRVAP